MGQMFDIIHIQTQAQWIEEQRPSILTRLQLEQLDQAHKDQVLGVVDQRKVLQVVSDLDPLLLG